MRTDDSLAAEIRRRRFWACYLMHCHTSEKLLLVEQVADVPSVPLPWPEEDFESKASNCPEVTLISSEGNGGVYSNLIGALTIW